MTPRSRRRRWQGHFGPFGETPVVPSVQPIVHPYLVAEDELLIHLGQMMRLTLLMHPGGKVHLTSGVLPRKSLQLARDWVRPGLSVIAPSARVGPVLIDTKQVRLPKISAFRKNQTWTRRETPSSWKDDPILAATQTALLPDLPHEVRGGLHPDRACRPRRRGRCVVTRYEWPNAPDFTFSDDALGRAEHNERLRVALAPPPPPAPGGGPQVALAPPPRRAEEARRGCRSARQRCCAARQQMRRGWPAGFETSQISDDGKRAYAAAAGGGVWFTEDRGTTWRPLGDWATTTLAHPERASVRLSCGALFVDFGTRDDGREDFVVVGTGELTPIAGAYPAASSAGSGYLSRSARLT